MRVVFLGTPDFACASLSALVQAGHAVVAVVTQPDRPVGRGGQLAPSPVKRLAAGLGFLVLQPRRVKHPEAVAALQALAPDLLVTAAFGQILSPEVLAIPRRGALNVHASLLPRYRGAAPIHRAVLAGEPETGVTIMWMDSGLDTGDMLTWRAVPIAPTDTAGAVHDRLAALGAELLVAALELIDAGQAPRIPQNHEQATYAAKLERQDERIDWTEPAAATVNRVRGLSPWPGAYTTFRTGTLKIWQAQALSIAAAPTVSAGPTLPTGAAPGTFLGILKGEGPAVAAGAGEAVILLQVQPEGRRPMTGAAWAAGARPHPGEQFGAEMASA